MTGSSRATDNGSGVTLGGGELGEGAGGGTGFVFSGGSQNPAGVRVTSPVASFTRKLSGSTGGRAIGAGEGAVGGRRHCLAVPGEKVFPVTGSFPQNGRSSARSVSPL